MKKTVIGIAAVQILIFLTILFRAENLSLLSYINNSFIYGGVIVFVGLWIFVIRTGVFDIFTISMRKVFKAKSTMEDDEMRPPSELIDFSSAPLLIIGFITLLLMGLMLVIYEL
ncbi:DUF3899 domain-containing protein [Planomicrobium sp. CPCC 101110]|uniref:DUF3899 domain-containing protein n=1 Tax=Planomicrobium sp. CPCC 101110 TaxID=2599619 RepID=UPI0011B520A2|nr:DUF3899 domain-containing protein [Planomicrobium sp. CPCC 101110]TWT27979.1 DUF3899 domain-containing protein [Planomicrobium sp. CPCC 101110]